MFHTKETIYWTKGQNLLTIIDTKTKTSSPFYGTLLMTKSYVFIEILLQVFPLRSPFWSEWLMFYIICFQTKYRATQKGGFIGEYRGEYFLRRRHGNEIYVITVTGSCNFNRVLNLWSKYNGKQECIKTILYDLKLHAIMKSSVTMIVLRSKNKEKYISIKSVWNAKYVKACRYLVSIQAVVSFQTFKH